MDEKKPRTLGLKQVNWCLLIAIIVINGWVIGLPLYTVGTLWWQDHIEHTPEHLSQLIASHEATKSKPAAQPVPAGERLIIPVISLNQPIIEGASIYTVDKGVWRWPSGTNPTEAGNMVLIGHRFTYAGPAVFAHMDLVKVGDKIAVWWSSKQYIYTVTQIKVVAPSDTSIIQPTNDTRLTIYTCTPMWSTTHRLAVIAEQDKS